MMGGGKMVGGLRGVVLQQPRMEMDEHQPGRSARLLFQMQPNGKVTDGNGTISMMEEVAEQMGRGRGKGRQR